MTTHLYPGQRPNSFRNRFSFKPQFKTHEWQRPTGGDPSMPGIYDKGPDSLHLRASAEQLPTIRGSCSSSQSQKFTRTRSSSRGGGRNKDDHSDRIETVERLTWRFDAMIVAAEDEDAKAENATHGGADLYTAVGIALYNMGCDNSQKSPEIISELVRKWDKNGKSDVNKTEFRMGVKSAPPHGLGLTNDIHQIDELFDLIDKDASGSVGSEELRNHLDKMLTSAKKAFAKAQKNREAAEVMRSKAARIKEVTEITSMYEEAEAEWKAVKEQIPVAAQLGSQIVKKGIKINEIILKWDDSQSGEISKYEFRKHVREIGVTSTNTEIDKCFQEFDADGGGTLDIEELKPLLKGLASKAKFAQEQEAALEKTSLQKRKAAKRAQLTLMAELGDAWQSSPRPIQRDSSPRKSDRSASPSPGGGSEGGHHEKEDDPDKGRAYALLGF